MLFYWLLLLPVVDFWFSSEELILRWESIWVVRGTAWRLRKDDFAEDTDSMMMERWEMDSLDRECWLIISELWDL